MSSYMSPPPPPVCTHAHIAPRPFRCFPLDLFSGSTKFTRIWNLGTKIGKSRETLEPGNSSSVRWENKQRDQLTSIIFRVDVWRGMNMLKDLNIAWCIWWCLHSLHRMPWCQLGKYLGQLVQYHFLVFRDHTLVAHGKREIIWNSYG